jgi:hypothetical protein
MLHSKQDAFSDWDSEYANDNRLLTIWINRHYKTIEIEIEIKHSDTCKTGWSLWAPPYAMPKLDLEA